MQIWLVHFNRSTLLWQCSHQHKRSILRLAHTTRGIQRGIENAAIVSLLHLCLLRWQWCSEYRRSCTAKQFRLRFHDLRVYTAQVESPSSTIDSSLRHRPRFPLAPSATKLIARPLSSAFLISVRLSLSLSCRLILSICKLPGESRWLQH